MYKVNASYQQLTIYLRLLQTRKLIARTADGFWVPTDGGRKYLEAFGQLKQILGEEKEDKKAEKEQYGVTEA